MIRKRKNSSKTRNVIRTQKSKSTFNNPFSSRKKKRKARNVSSSNTSSFTDLSEFIDTSENKKSYEITKIKGDYRIYIALGYIVLILISLMYISTTTEAKLIENTQKQKKREKLEFVRIFYNNQLMQLKTRSGIYQMVKDNGLQTINEPPKVIKVKEVERETE